MSHAARRVLLGSALALLASCSSATPLPAPFVFDTPGEVELVCFNRLTAAATERLVSDDDVVLPFECCEPQGCKLEDINLPNVKAEDFHPVAHALVTQIDDGEVAAVDLESSKVLDSERRIPGYTFVNVGGQPSAIVVPKSLPVAAPLESSEPVPASGPIWTYVAGGDPNSIRAIPTCRFLLGRPCGPELVEADDESKARPDFRLHTELLLPAAPQDMLLDPNGDALWITLPSVGWIARVQLGTSADRLLPGREEAEGPMAPFAFVAPPEAGVAAQFAPTFFQVAQGLDLGSDPRTAPEPIAEASSYQALCGLGYVYQATPQLQLPNAPRAPSNGAPEPTRMRLMPASAEHPALLFVADRGQVALHAYAIEGGVLQSRGASYVGARLRDFAITPRVPNAVPALAALKSGESAYPASTDEPQADDKQYLYAIDDLGGVMAFDLSFEGTTPRLQPLLAPLPRRDSLDMQNNYADRIWVNGGESAARALEVVDTRDSDLAAGSKEYCGQVAPGLLTQAVEDAKKALREQQAKLKTAAEGDKQAIREEVKLAEKALATAERHAAIPEDAGPTALRGVFVVIAASDGRVTVLDVHDLDLQCRVRESCTGKADTFATPVDDSGEAFVAVRRHTVRLETYKEANVSLLGRDQLLSEVTCPDGYRPTVEESGICVPTDPWRQRDASWSVLYEGSVFDVPLATLERSEADPENQLVLRAPTGMNLCKRGVLGGQFQVAIASAAADVPNDLGCPTVTRETAQRLLVTEAFHDHLVLSLLPREGRNAQAPSELLACYPRFVGVQLLIHEAYLVTNGTYLHRAKVDDQDPEGRCVEDANLSPLFSSRAVPTEMFQDPSIAFRLADPGQGDPADINPTVTLGSQSVPIRRVNVDANSGRSDALPRRVRYFSETGDLFIVDQASQGLKRYTLTPFEPDNSRFR